VINSDLNDLTEWISEKDPSNFCFLVGAGISIKSGLPTGVKFIASLINIISSSTEDNQKLHNIAGSNSTPEEIFSKVENHKFLRFESLMACIRRYIDDKSYRSLLDCFTCENPTKAHWLLASFLDKYSKQIVLTTNFDTLIEQARLSINPKINPAFISEDEHLSYEHGLFKLHGTVARWREGKIINLNELNSEDLPAASLDDLGRIRNSERRRTRFINSVSNASLLIIAGYSGSDVFDVIAWLKGTSPKAILWIEHEENEANNEILNGQDIINLKKRTLSIETLRTISEKIFRSGGDPKTQMKYVRVNTDIIWNKVLVKYSNIYLDNYPDTATYSWEDKLQNWGKKINKNQRNIITAASYFEAAQYEDTIRILKPLKSDPIRDSLLAQVLLIKEGKPWKKTLLIANDLVKNVESKFYNQGYLIKSKIFHRRRGKNNRELALSFIENVISHTSSIDRVEAFFIKAQLLRDAVKHTKAAEAALNAYKTSKVEGNLLFEASALHERAKNLDRTASKYNDIYEALENINEAIILRKQLVLPKDLINGLNVRCVMLQHLADFLFLEGNIEKAKEALKEAFLSAQEANKKAEVLQSEWEKDEINLNIG